MDKFTKELLGEFILAALLVAVTLSLTRSSNIHFHLALYLSVEILAFLMFPVFGAVSVAVAATFIAITALMITGEIIALPAIVSFWIAAIILNSFLDIANRRRGEFRLELENRENDIAVLSSRQEELLTSTPFLKEKLSRYQVLSDISLKLTTTLKQQVIYSIVKECLELIFPDGRVVIISTPMDQYSAWVRNNVRSLLVENVKKDYRFSEFSPDCGSLIESPLLRQHKVFGSLRIESPEKEFTPADMRLLSSVSSLAIIALEKVRLFNKIEELSIRDSLTKLFTHKYFMERLHEEINRSARYREKFTLFMMDIDKFKEFNDSFGHRAGDKVLKKVAAAIKSSVRETDIVGRYGGEEISVLLLNINRAKTEKIAVKIRKKIEELSFRFNGKEVGVTITIGAASFPENPTGESILKSADRALYKGKREGRNKVVFEEK